MDILLAEDEFLYVMRISSRLIRTRGLLNKIVLGCRFVSGFTWCVLISAIAGGLNELFMSNTAV